MSKTERRKNIRHKVKSGIVALLHHDKADVAKINDISEEGLSFIYTGENNFLEKSIELDILIIDRDIFLPNVACELISEKNIVLKKGNIYSQKARRCCVKLNKLASRLVSDIQNNI